jgi:hypothetical protein
MQRDLITWSGCDLNDDMQVNQAKRLLKLFGKSGLHFAKRLQRYEIGQMVSAIF